MSTREAGAFRLKLPYRAPFDFSAVLEFLQMRATPGVEQVDNGIWSRSIQFGEDRGWVRVRDSSGESAVECEIDLPSPHRLMSAAERIRQVFDLNADPFEIDTVLSRDPALAPLVAAHPGRRVPGAWDPFEVTIRAIVGQQVSVKGATTIMGRIAQTFGEEAGGSRYFPQPSSLASLDPGELPMPRQRAEAIRELSRRVAIGEIDFTASSPAELQAALVAIKGIGPWTAQYAAMRAAGDPDALLSGDLVLRRVAKLYLGIDTEQALLERAEGWRPWRAYAGVHLWSIAGDYKQADKGKS